MRLYRTTDPLPTSNTDQYHVYNALDCCITREVFDVLRAQLDEVTEKTYELECSLQGPVLEMQMRGVKIDTYARDKLIKVLTQKSSILEEDLREILVEGIGFEASPSSPKQLIKLFYEVLKLPVQRNFKTGQPTVDRKALEKLRSYFHAVPIVNSILAIRDLQKKTSMLATTIDGDGRIRTSFGIAGTDTGRFSSYVSSFGSGSNLQTVTEELRHVYIADPGMRLAYIDLEQAESRAVGAIEWNLFHDGRYLDACESGDLHTSVARMCWPNLPWTGDLIKDKKIGKGIFYRKEDYRQGAKKLGHSTNYYGKPPEISKQTGIPLDLVKPFQLAYFKAYPAHAEWHSWVRSKLLKDGFITTFMGRRRRFFGRRWEDETVRGAIAYEPQSSIADYLNRGMLKVWKSDLPVQLLLQMHDAILVQYPEELENEIVPKIQRMLELRIPLLHGRELVIPTEAMVGWNWGKLSEKDGNVVNPNGLITFTGNDPRKRIAQQNVLDLPFSEA